MDEHPDASSAIRRSNETLRLPHIETHARSQDDRQEVRQRVRDRGAHTEDPCETPDLQVQTRAEELLPVELLRHGITSVLVHAGDDHSGLILVEEAPIFVRIVGEAL